MIDANDLITLTTVAGVLCILATPVLALALVISIRSERAVRARHRETQENLKMVNGKLRDERAMRSGGSREFAPTHNHADEGVYRFDGMQSAKMPGGEWVEGVRYTGKDGRERWTSWDRWIDRFEPIGGGLHVSFVEMMMRRGKP